MDFKSLLSKIESIDGKIETPAAPELPKTVKLNEDAELRVLAGTSSILEEAKKMKKDDKKMEEKTEEGLDMNLLKAAQKGQEGKPVGKPDPESDKNVRKKYGYRMDGEPAERDDDPTKQERRGRKRKNEDVEIDAEKFQEKFAKMVEAKKSKPDFLDMDKDGNKKEPMKKAIADKKKGAVEEAKKSYSAKEARKGKDIGKPGKNFEKIAKKAGKEYGSKEKGEKVAGAVLKKLRAKEGVESSKKVVAESVETKMSFKDMLRIVKESGGQQQIDPVDQTLWSWANRVATSKVQESQKAEIFAAMIYERNGGRFEMYDVLAESKKNVNEEADSRVAKLAKLTIQIMEKDGAKVGPNSDFHTIFDVLEQDLQGEKILRLVKQLDNEDFNTWERMIHDHFMPY